MDRHATLNGEVDSRVVPQNLEAGEQRAGTAVTFRGEGRRRGTHRADCQEEGEHAATSKHVLGQR